MCRLLPLKFIALFLGIILLFLSPGGCKKPEPARIILAVDGELFSDALLIIDGKQAGKLTQTLVKPDGSLYIDGIVTAKLPPGHRDIPESNDYQGTIDSLEVKAGEHIILLQTEDGKTLEITASIPPGLHLVTYRSDEETLTWNNIKLKAPAGSSVNVKPE
jgi:hypothetical protein